MIKKESLNLLPSRGVYTLVILLIKNKTLKVGKFGKITFPKGYYAYTGSALGPHERSLQNRIYRHLSKEKTIRWHIDYLLKHKEAIVKAVLAAETDEKQKECEINKLIMKKLKGKIVVKGFGASDCKQNCESHLIFLNQKRNVEYAISILYQNYFNGKFMSIILV